MQCLGRFVIFLLDIRYQFAIDLESDAVILFHELGLLCSRVSGLEIGNYR